MAQQNRTRPATLRTIADAANVDISTVSRVLNGAPEDASRAASLTTVAAIREAAARLDYRPNPHRRACAPRVATSSACSSRGFRTSSSR